MASTTGLNPDPSMLGGVTSPPFVILPDPARLFAQRARRCAALAVGNPMAPYLEFVAALMRVQAAVVAADAGPLPLPAEELERARGAGMPPLDRHALIEAPGLWASLIRFLARAESVPMPQPAAEALRDLRAAGPGRLRSVIETVLLHDAPRGDAGPGGGGVPPDDLAAYLFVAAGLQIFAARLAATLDAARLGPVATGICPVCGGLPVASTVVGTMGAEGARYATCALCATQWNEVRIKCLACGSTKGLSYRAVESGTQPATDTEPAIGDEPATVKAELCGSCNGWIKILYQNKNPSLEAVADDVASLGLDLLMREAGHRRAGLNPFLLGY